MKNGNQPSPMQAETLNHIEQFVASNGYSPTISDLAEIAGITENAAFGRVEGLLKKGLATRKPGVSRSLRPANASGPVIDITAAHDLYDELKRLVDNAEQSSFEEWLTRTSPSGDAESVHSQWRESYDYEDFWSLWESAIIALDKARGES